MFSRFLYCFGRISVVRTITYGLAQLTVPVLTAFFFSIKPNCKLIPVISLSIFWLFCPNESSYSAHDQRLRKIKDIGIHI